MTSKAPLIATLALVTVCFATAAEAHSSRFKSPGPGMHFTEGQPIIVFADISDSADGHGLIVNGVGWPQMQVLVDGVLWKDSVTNSETVQGANKKDMNGNPDPQDFYRFSLAGVPAGMHQLVVRGLMTPPPQSDGAKVDSPPITVIVDPVPAGKTMMSLTGDVTGPVNWNNVFVVGNGFVVNASGAVTIKDSIVTGLGSMTKPGITGTSSALDVQNSIFENTGSFTMTLTGEALIKNNEFRANNLLTFKPPDPDAVAVIELTGNSSAAKKFQGNRVGAGRVVFRSMNNWLVGGDTDDLSNVIIGPRGTVYFVNGARDIIFRGNYVHHAYRGGWSQGFNLSFQCNLCNLASGTNVLSEHNVLRGGSWIVQSLVGEFRYNLVYGYGHTWIRTAVTGASIHHNLFVPEFLGGLDGGIQLYINEKNIQIFNNTFDGGGTMAADFIKSFVDLSGSVQVTTLRNNLFTFARGAISGGGPGGPGIKASAGNLVSADYNSFYNPDNPNKDNYSVADLMEGTGTFASHDVSAGGVGMKDAQLGMSPYAGARIFPYEAVVDEAAVWNGTQKVSQILAAFRARYTPAAGAPIIDAGDPADSDSMGRKADIGAVDLAGHDQDKVGKFGTAPSESTPPTVALTAPAAGASITGMTTLSATAMDSGSGVVLVQFQVDGSTVAQVAKSPYSISWNSAVVSNAAHMFTAKAWDAAGNFAVSAAVMATVTGNTPTTKPTPGTAGSSGSSSGTAGASGTAGVTGNATGTAGSGVATGSGCGCAHTGGASFAGLGLALSLMVLTRGRRRRD
jgi:hypothetical protein